MASYLEEQKALREGRRGAIESGVESLGFGIKNLPRAPAQGVATTLDVAGVPRFGAQPRRAVPAETGVQPTTQPEQAIPSPVAQNTSQPSGAGELERMQAVGAAEKRAGVGTPTLHAYDPNDFIDRGKLHTPAPAAIQEAPRAEAVPNLGDMTWGQLATWSAQQRLKGKERGYAAQQEMEGKRQAGAERIEGMREQGALGRTEREAALRREAAGEEREFNRPYREAQIGALGAQTKSAEAQAAETGLKVASSKKIDDAMKVLANPDKYKDKQGVLEGAKAILASAGKRGYDEEQEIAKYLISQGKRPGTMEDIIPVGRKDGGLIEGYADGGAIGRSQTGELNPLVAQYGQYISEAARAGVSPVPFAKYLNLMSSTRDTMQGTPTQFADGGDVSALNRPLEGPGTGRSDSIPAVIDGGQPAALSKGEFVIPEHVVRKKGTEFFEKLIAQYAEEAQANG